MCCLLLILYGLLVIIYCTADQPRTDFELHVLPAVFMSKEIARTAGMRIANVEKCTDKVVKRCLTYRIQICKYSIETVCVTF